MTTEAIAAEEPRPTARLIATGAFFMLGLIAMLGRLYQMQVMQHAFWLAKMSTGSEVSVRIPSVRGEIRDRNGVTLAANHESYSVEFYLPDIVRNYRAENGNVPRHEYFANVKGMKRMLGEPDIVKVVNESAMPRLEQLGLAEDYNSEKLRLHFRTKREVPFVFRSGIDFSKSAKYVEGGTGLPGVEITNRPARQYPYGALGAHLLGYIGAIRNLEEQEDVGEFTFYEPDSEGKSQVEHACNKWLRGQPGARILHRSAKGIVEGEIRRIDPKQGNNVLLTIDARLQYIVERALRDAGIGRGAAVVVDPNNGDILAMASVPSYDPNIFIPSVNAADWKKITDDNTDPLTNRAVQCYAPGSIYKVVTALAELRAGIPPTRTFTCTGGVQYGNKYMKCWIAGRGTHGPLDLRDAIKNSCNAYFYQAGNAAGINNIVAVGEALGLGKKTGIPLSGESGGILPGPKWLNLVNPAERWSDGHTANVSIGQGYVLTSPLQMAMVAATIANRGTAYQPRLVYRVLDQDGADARDPKTGHVIAAHEPKVHADLRRSGISADQIEAVRDGMRRVVASGTGRRAQIKGVDVAGKTGTAQFWRGDVQDNHTWFIAFAPYDAPKLALCVMVQGAKSGGGVSAPIAREILEQALALDHGYDPGLVAMTPAIGSFAQITAVDYKNPPRAIPAGVSEPVIARAVPVNPNETTIARAVPGPSEPIVARALPANSSETFMPRDTSSGGSILPDPLDDPETADVIEPVEPEIRRAIFVAPPRAHAPEILPKPDVIVEVRPTGL
jgi:penicillin-binding protein 2